MIKKNDNANGIVQLSASAVRVREPHTGSVVNVTRTAGDFGTVSEHEFCYMPRSLRFSMFIKTLKRPNYLRLSWLVSMPSFHSRVRVSRLAINAVFIPDVTPKQF